MPAQGNGAVSTTSGAASTPAPPVPPGELLVELQPAVASAPHSPSIIA
jgi:hypothetical protein